MLSTKMTCPTCGLLPLADQKFCRSCGTSLQLITQPLAGPATLSDLERRSAIASKGEVQRGNRLVLWGFIMMLIGAAIGVLGKLALHEDIVTVVGVLISLAGMFLVVYPYLSPSPRQKNDSSPSSPPEVLTPSQTKEYLPQGSNIEYVPSITERTTDLLKNSAIRPGHKEEGDNWKHNSEKKETP